MNSPWVIIAAGLHQKGGMDKANFALSDYLLEREIPVHLVTHSVDPSLGKHPLATVHLAARPANSFFLGEFALSALGKKVARRILRQYSSAQVVVNGGNFSWAFVGASAASLPIVTSAIGRAPEIIEESNGRLPPNDPEALAAFLPLFIGQPGRRRIMGADGCRRVHQMCDRTRQIRRLPTAPAHAGKV